jgi:hypothetical protein
MDPAALPSAVPPTGAAYVLISHGETGGGGYLSSGQLATTSSADDGAEEERNYANVALALATFYVDDSLNDATDANLHFDDVVSRPSIMTVVSKAGLGPRSHN